MGWFAKFLPLLLWLLEQLQKSPLPADVKTAGNALKTALTPHAAKTAKTTAIGHGSPDECVEAIGSALCTQAESACKMAEEIMGHAEHLAGGCKP